MFHPAQLHLALVADRTKHGRVIQPDLAHACGTHVLKTTWAYVVCGLKGAVALGLLQYGPCRASEDQVCLLPQTEP